MCLDCPSRPQVVENVDSNALRILKETADSLWDAAGNEDRASDIDDYIVEAVLTVLYGPRFFTWYNAKVRRVQKAEAQKQFDEQWEK